MADIVLGAGDSVGKKIESDSHGIYILGASIYT